MLLVQNNLLTSYALDGIYDSMYATIASLSNTILLSDPDRYTGLSLVKANLLVAINENQENAASVASGISLVQTTDTAVDSIKEKLEEMKEIAEDVAEGGYSGQEITLLQEQFDQLADEIDLITAATTPGGYNMLTDDDGTVQISIGSGLTIDINTDDLTITGLGVIEEMNLHTDPDAAAAGLEDALTQVDSYIEHLEVKFDSLESAAEALSQQSESLLAIRSAVESTDSAMLLVSTLENSFLAEAQMLLIVQANTNAETVLGLLSD